MLKRKIDKAAFDALSDEMKKVYTEKDGAYFLDADDAAELQGALNRTREEARLLKEKVDTAEREKNEAAETARLAAEEAAKKTGNITALETSWQTKLDKEKADGAAREAKLNKQIEKLLVDNIAKDIANKISVAPSLILPHIQKRLAAELSGDEPVTRVLDSTGKPSAATIEDLEKEFVANAEFAAIIKGSNASGGSANNNSRGSGSAGKKISEMTETERVALHKEIGAAEFQRRVAAKE